MAEDRKTRSGTFLLILAGIVLAALSGQLTSRIATAVVAEFWKSFGLAKPLT